MNLALIVLKDKKVQAVTFRPEDDADAPRIFRFNLHKQILLLLMVGGLSWGAYAFFRENVVTSVEVQGNSMLPTLVEGQRYLLNCAAYLGNEPRPGDLVAIRRPGSSELVVKRIIAVPGESVLLKRGGDVYVNGNKLHEPYLAPHTPTFAPDAWEKLLVVGRDRYYVLGDNRLDSEDSRHYGPVPRERILGMVMHTSQISLRSTLTGVWKRSVQTVRAQMGQGFSRS